MNISFELTPSENKDLIGYCELNNLNPDLIVKKSYLEGFRIEKYGLLNPTKTSETQEKWVEKEVIREKRVEIPVEVIKEVIKIEYVEVPVEVIKEVPVDRVVEKIVEVTKEIPVEKVVIKEVIKEVPVEKVVTKIEYICDNTQTNELLLKIQELESRPSKVVEVIKEIIKEVPVEVIKEVVVEKETTDNSLKPKLEALQNTVQKLKEDNIAKDKLIREYEQTIKDIQVHQQGTKAMYMRGSNLN